MFPGLQCHRNVLVARALPRTLLVLGEFTAHLQVPELGLKERWERGNGREMRGWNREREGVGEKRKS